MNNFILGRDISNRLCVGYERENEARSFTFDFSEWAATYGTGALTMLFQRQGDASPYPVALSIDGTVATWKPSATDTAKQGQAVAQFIYTVGETIVKTQIFYATIGKSLVAGSAPPDPYETWIEKLTELGAETLVNAEAAEQSAENAAQSAEDASNSAAAALESEKNALNSENAAKASEIAAGLSETNALASERAAKASENAAALSEGNARQSANAAYQSAGLAANSATQAATSASNASADADRAEQAADNIEANVQRAETAAESAREAASDASGFADTASTKATEAAASASSASSSAATATQKASDASASATAAASSATAANTAKAAAETAQGKAEGAQEAAETAATNAQASADDAAQSAQEAASEILKAFPHDTASGSIANISDGAALPVRDLSVDIEPVQDLHGYDNPWPAGGGVNKLIECVPGTYTGTNCQAVVSADGTITVSGTTGGSPETINIPLKEKITTPSEQFYIHLFNTVNASIAPSFELSTDVAGTTINAACSPANRIYTVSTNRLGVEIDRVRFWISANKDAAVTLHPMFALTNSVVPWTPYSNICPISGRTSATVTRTGKNLADSTHGNTVPSISNGQMVSANGWSTPFIKIDNAKEYTFSFTGSAGRYVLFYDSMQNYLGNATNPNNGYHLSSYEKYAQVGYVKLRSDSGIGQNPLLQLEIGSTATAYEPYSAETYSITFPTEAGTVYGGTLDVTTGKLTVDRAMSEISEVWAWVKSSSYPGGFYTAPQGQLHYKTFAPFISSHAKTARSIAEYLPGTCHCDNSINFRIMDANSTVQDWEDYIVTQRTNGTPIQMCYELATPIEVDLTPTEVSTLLGTNNVWSDTGDSTVDYYADPTLFVNKKIAAAVAAMS